MQEQVRIAIVGAATLAGKELAEAIAEGPFAAAELLLMDDDDGLGQLAAAGDEAAIVSAIDAEAFARIDYVFFAGPKEQTLAHWRAAAEAHASIIDLHGALESQPGVLVSSPWTQDAVDDSTAPRPDLYTPALVSAHIVSVTLALLVARVMQTAPVRSAWATVQQPASQHGRAAVDELHQQTVALLNFQSLPKDIYDTQVAFNLSPAVGEEAKFPLADTQEMIERHYALIAGRSLPPVAVQLIQSPVFHGYCISVGLELERPVSQDELEAVLASDHLDVVMSDTDPPNNLSCAGQDDALLRIRRAEPGDGPATRYWVWAALDNLKMGSLHALVCAAELSRLRPRGKVQ